MADKTSPVFPNPRTREIAQALVARTSVAQAVADGVLTDDEIKNCGTKLWQLIQAAHASDMAAARVLWKNSATAPKNLPLPSKVMLKTEEKLRDQARAVARPLVEEIFAMLGKQSPLLLENTPENPLRYEMWGLKAFYQKPSATPGEPDYTLPPAKLDSLLRYYR